MKNIHHVVPFTESLIQMPTYAYAKFLKEIFTNKRILEGNETITMMANISTMIQNMFPTKLKELKDPECFSHNSIQNKCCT